MVKPFKVNISDQVLEAIYAKVKKYPVVFLDKKFY